MATILVIDDDKTMRRALRLSLEKLGHSVLEALNGREGLAAFKKTSPDLVVTDLIMPDMEGVETIRELRKLSAVVPIFAITGGGRGSPENYLSIARQFGASHVFSKPFDFDAFCAVANQVLGPASADSPFATDG